jgi:hypothetical protein
VIAQLLVEDRGHDSSVAHMTSLLHAVTEERSIAPRSTR